MQISGGTERKNRLPTGQEYVLKGGAEHERRSMGNSPASVKAVAERVTTSNGGEAIYTALKNLKFKLLPSQ